MDFNELYKNEPEKNDDFISGCYDHNSENSEEYSCETFQHHNFHNPDPYEVERKWKSLNEKFQHDIKLFERLLGGMEDQEKSLASEWVNKLKENPPNLNEALARNHILEYLLRFCKCNVLNWKPFNNPSALHTFSKFQSFMPHSSLKKKSVIELVNNSVDNGDFLYKLPVPRDGSFFIVHLAPNLSNSLLNSFKF